jgi:hypothetical protein
MSSLRTLVRFLFVVQKTRIERKAGWAVRR